MNPNDELNRLGYKSSAPDLLPRGDEPKAIDEDELSTIELLFRMIAQQKAELMSPTALDRTEKTHSLKDQLYLNDIALKNLQNQESLLVSTISKVRNKLNERG